MRNEVLGFCFFFVSFVVFGSLASVSLFLSLFFFLSFFAHDSSSSALFFVWKIAVLYIQPRLQNPTIPRIRHKGARVGK